MITIAGTDRESICYEVYMKALDLLESRRIDSIFYLVVYGLVDDEAWHDEKNCYKVNPSLGYTIRIDHVRDHTGRPWKTLRKRISLSSCG